MYLPILGSRCHASKEIHCIHNAEVTRVAILEFNWKMLQEACAGSGNDELNKVSKSLFKQQCQVGTFPNDLEGISVIAFSFPGMCSGVSGHAEAKFNQSANARTNCAATLEWRVAMR